MVSAKGLYYNSQNTKDLLRKTEYETPSCVQIFGSEKEFLVRAINSKELDGFDIIDINMGCPMPKIVKNGDGSALLKDTAKAAEIVEACAKTGRNVTVKMRLGWDSSDCAVTFARAMQDSGAKMICVHGRTTAQMYGGKADWDEIGAVAAALDIPVVGNGDITDAASAEFALKTYPVSGIMIGRGALGKPDIFAHLTGSETPTLKDIILRHIAYMRESFSERHTVTNMRKHLACYLKGVSGMKKLRQEINYIESADVLAEKIESAFKYAKP